MRSLASRGFDQRGTPAAYIGRRGDRFPATPESSIQPNNIEPLVPLQADEVQFRIKQFPFGIEHLQVVIEAPKKSLIGEPNAVLEGLHQVLLLDTLFPTFMIADQGV